MTEKNQILTSTDCGRTRSQSNKKKVGPIKI